MTTRWRAKISFSGLPSCMRTRGDDFRNSVENNSGITCLAVMLLVNKISRMLGVFRPLESVPCRWTLRQRQRQRQHLTDCTNSSRCCLGPNKFCVRRCPDRSWIVMRGLSRTSAIFGEGSGSCHAAGHTRPLDHCTCAGVYHLADDP